MAPLVALAGLGSYGQPERLRWDRRPAADETAAVSLGLPPLAYTVKTHVASRATATHPAPPDRPQTVQPMIAAGSAGNVPVHFNPKSFEDNRSDITIRCQKG